MARGAALTVVVLAALGTSALLDARAHAQGANAVLESEIAQVEARVDVGERRALERATHVQPGDPNGIAVLGEVMFFDKNLSVNRNTACAFCHMPETGFQGDLEIVNRTIVDQPGSVRTRFSLRKPPSAAYAALAPPLYYRKSTSDFVGGNFWDVRATGSRLRNPAASQAEGSPLNPTEMANREPACVVRRLAQRPYRAFFEQTLGPRAFDVRWPGNVDAICSQPNDNQATRIGSEVPGPTNTPWAVRLDPHDRVRVQETFDAMAIAIAAYEASPAVSAFSSKFDAFLAGKARLSAAEQRGYALFNGKALCSQCHLDNKGDRRPLFTDETTDSLGIPKNPALAYYGQTRPDRYGYVGDPAGARFVDRGVGDFLRSPEDGNDTGWHRLAGAFDGRFRIPTLRNVDKRPSPDFAKAYGHNGYFTSLKEIVHFYNTRDALPRCAVGSPGVNVRCWPAPEVAANVNRHQLGNLHLTDGQEDDIVAFLRTLSDGYAETGAGSSAR
ncbi:MAG: cytochrome c peroxidase [Vulcanimicrobiaceae bacterium]|jgi:cytochrome c peroxidase